MYPEHVGRVILDGVVDADHYVEPTWMDSLRDADAIWDDFFVYCAQAGPACHIFQIGDRPEDIKKKFDHVMALIAEQPVIVVSEWSNTPILVTASDLKGIAFSRCMRKMRVTRPKLQTTAQALL
ncbi:Uu.00g089880.m01.CDS01 [Anthostomella pinea]|uniref:Uu.00g089880.m01.CDS01 n=1 Tax=Anthostomella pinea TaxID=933095 RepID=A0AAI8YK90_9PEZI|nr:Uu.00g089880.m01.CDS01 [Anthostomella pinea]